MTPHLTIDFVSDVSCPWCIIGLQSLEQAIARVADSVTVDLCFQPFELNPDMPPEGQDIGEHLAQKYGATAEQTERNRAAIRARGAELGFTFSMQKRSRIHNTFNAHRLLHWAREEGKQAALKHALFAAYFTDGQNPDDAEVLIKAARAAGLDPEAAANILASDAFADAVREREQLYRDQGINSVPAVIIDGRHLISGGQPVEVFERALRQIVAAR